LILALIFRGFVPSLVMDMPSTPAAAPPVTPEKLALAQQAFEQFHTQCFWFMREDAQITEQDIPYICERLRGDGGRAGFLLAAQICQ
jgi:hypothetical protein